VVACFLLIVAVLLQRGRDCRRLRRGSNQTAFGARQGATVLTKATTILGAIFMVGALGLAVLGQRSSSVLGGMKAGRLCRQRPAAPQSAPAPVSSTPAAPAAPTPGRSGRAVDAAA
jgi:preprotein translocase subunit SecG